MKESLKNAIKLFSSREQFIIYLSLICLKVKLKITGERLLLFNSCIAYKQLFDAGIDFKKDGEDLIKAVLAVNEKKITVFIRKHSSDLQVLKTVLLQGEYKLAVNKIIGNSIKVSTILDAGGNIGLTTVYLHIYFPEARFIIVEPDKMNAEILKMNLKVNGISSASLYQKALWVNSENLILDHSFRDGKEWSISVAKADDNQNNQTTTIEGISLQEICKLEKIKQIELFKIDIEGAERFLFKDQEFLTCVNEKVTNLVIEIHDEFLIREKIESEMKNIGFQKDDDGDITLYWKI